MANEKQISELVAMIDQFVTSGGGHMNVEVQNQDHMEMVDLQTRNSNCCQKNMACQVPTLHEGLDRKE